MNKKKVQPISMKQLIFVLEALDTDQEELDNKERLETILHTINRNIKRFGGNEE